MNNLTNLLPASVQARLKAVVSALGGVLLVLQVVVQVHPDPRLSALIALLTTLGVHQVTNK